MRKVIILVFIVILAIGGYFTYQKYKGYFITPNVITNYPPKGNTIVAFGDSLIQGVGASPGNDVSSDISHILLRKIINEGKSGDTTQEGLDRINDVLQENPNIVLVLFGGNDALQGVPITTTFNNLSTIIEKLQNAGAIVVLLGVPGGLTSDPYAARYQALADKYHTAYVPNVLQGLIGNQAYMSDEVHPNDAGYLIMAGRIAPVVQKLLK